MKSPSSDLVELDPSLPFMDTALNKKKMEPFFIRLFESQNEQNNNVILRNVRKVRYKRGLRCLFEYDLEITNQEKKKKFVTLLGKMQYKGLDKTTFKLQKSLERSGFNFSSPDNIMVPSTVGTIPEVNLWLQKKVEGTPSIELLVKKKGVELAKKIAESIDKVHKTNIPIHRKHTIQKELRILKEQLGKVVENNPELKLKIIKILNDSERLSRYLPPTNPVGIHRDFYHDQVLVKGNRLFLLDFDLYCMGDPALDIGNFVAHLQEISLRKFGNAKALSRLEKVMVERFLELSGEFRQTSIEIYTTLTLVRHIAISQRFLDRRQFTESLVSLCEERLQTQLSEFENLDYKHTKSSQKISD